MRGQIKISLFGYLITLVSLTLLATALSNDGKEGCTEGFVTKDKMDVLLKRTGTSIIFLENWQVIFPQVGFTCNGNLQRIVFGTSDIQRRMDQRPQLQIWRPVGDTAYMLVNQYTLVLASTSLTLQEYDLPFDLNFQTGDVIGYYLPNSKFSQFSLLLEYSESNESLKCAYFTKEPYGVFSSLDVEGIQLNCAYNIIFHLTTDPPGCGRGFMSRERMRYILDSSSVSSITTGIDQRQQISPDMRFMCDGFITKWTIMAKYAASNSLYPELQIWRNIENSTVYEKISGVTITMPLRQLSGVYEFDNFPPIAVKSGDILGISISDRLSFRLQLLSEITNTPLQYYIPTDPSHSSYDIINIEETLVKTSAYQPLVSVEFVRGVPNKKVITYTVTQTKCSTFFERERVRTPGLTPSSESSQRSSVGVCVGAGVGVALASIIAVLLVAIVIVLVTGVRTKQTATSEVELTRDSRNTQENPIYCGVAEPVYSGVQDESVYEIPTPCLTPSKRKCED